MNSEKEVKEDIKDEKSYEVTSENYSYDWLGRFHFFSDNGGPLTLSFWKAIFMLPVKDRLFYILNLRSLFLGFSMLFAVGLWQRGCLCILFFIFLGEVEWFLQYKLNYHIPFYFYFIVIASSGLVISLTINYSFYLKVVTDSEDGLWVKSQSQLTNERIFLDTLGMLIYVSPFHGLIFFKYMSCLCLCYSIYSHGIYFRYYRARAKSEFENYRGYVSHKKYLLMYYRDSVFSSWSFYILLVFYYIVAIVGLLTNTYFKIHPPYSVL